MRINIFFISSIIHLLILGNREICNFLCGGIQVWLRRVQNLLKQNGDGIQSVLKRAFLCLPERKRDKFQIQTAILEFKFGVADRGRALFDELVKKNRERTDWWSIYLDQVKVLSQIP